MPLSTAFIPIVLFAWGAEAVASAGAPPPVSIVMDDAIRLDNGIVRLVVDRGGQLVELRLRDGPNLAYLGYWNVHAGGYRGDEAMPTRFATPRGAPSVVRKTEDLVDVAFLRQPADPMFFRISLHYVLRRGESGFYVYMTAEHDGGMPPGRITQYCYNLRLAPDLFAYIAVDDRRRGLSHTCEEEREAEIVQDATFRLRDGRVVTKYDYCHDMEDGRFPLYGWAGPRAGVWWIQPSGEYYGAAPFRRLITAHQTAKSPVLIWQVHCTHRGGAPITFPPGDTSRWRKLYGPALVYINQGEDYDAMWRDAKRRVIKQKTRWPYRWMNHELYSLDRSTVSGVLRFNDGTPAAGAWVILSPPGANWSDERRGYHFWTRSDERGRFAIPWVRPGRYSLFAAGADQFEEFVKPNVLINDGEAKADWGELIWRRENRGKRLWQIGKADRSTGEFRNGDDFHHWGMWRRYPVQFPNDVCFEVGKSSEARDWNYFHWTWYTRQDHWSILFDLPHRETGTALLTIGVCMVRRTKTDVLVNGENVGVIDLPDTGGDIYRSARQSTKYSVVRFPFGAALLKRGRNTVVLRHRRTRRYAEGDAFGETGSGPGGLGYDALRLEIVPGERPETDRAGAPSPAKTTQE